MSWPLVKFKDVAKVVTGSTPKKVEGNYDGEIPFVTPGDLGELAVISKAKITVTEKGADSGRRLPKNTVMVCCIGATIGKVGISEREVVTNQQINSLVFDESKVIPKYGYYFCTTLKPLLVSRSSSTTMPIVNKSSFSELQIPLPPLDEQKRIAAILDKADAIRRKRQQAIDLADDFLRSVFLDMFGDPVTNPKGWEVKPLNSFVSKLGDGLHGTPSYDPDGEYFFVNGNNLIDGKIVTNESTKKVNEAEFQKHKKELNSNTMLVSINGTIGKIAFYNDEKVVLGKSACYFNLIPESISSVYLYYLIQSHYFLHYVSSVVTGSTIKNVSLKSMREMPIPLPQKNLQDKFENIVKKAQEMKIKHQISNQNSDDKFNSLSQRAFAGEL